MKVMCFSLVLMFFALVVCVGKLVAEEPASTEVTAEQVKAALRGDKPAGSTEEAETDTIDTPAGPVFNDAKDISPLPVGLKLPHAHVYTLEGKRIHLSNVVLKGKPTILLVYRGGWCPYCTRHLSAVNEVKDDLFKMGFQMVAISPDTPKDLKKMLGKTKINFTLLSDKEFDAARRFGLGFYVDAKTEKRYVEEFKIPLRSLEGETKKVLPVPSVYLLDADRRIHFVYTDSDYRERLSPEKIMAAAKRVVKRSDYKAAE